MRQHLPAFPVVPDFRRPVVDAGRPMRWDVGVVEVKRRCQGQRVVRTPFDGEEIRRVVDDHVLDEAHSACVQGGRKRTPVVPAAEPRIGRGEIAGPVAVVARETRVQVPRGIQHRRGEPNSRRSQPLDVVEVLQHAANIPAVEPVVPARVVGAAARIAQGGVRNGIAVRKPVRHRKVDDRVAWVGGLGTCRRETPPPCKPHAKKPPHPEGETALSKSVQDQSQSVPKAARNTSTSGVPTTPSSFKSPGQGFAASTMHEPSSMFAAGL